MNESLNDKTIEALSMVLQVKDLLRDVNDIGESSGFCDEQDQIVNDFHAMVGSMRARLSRLQRRVRLHNEANVV